MAGGPCGAAAGVVAVVRETASFGGRGHVCFHKGAAAAIAAVTSGRRTRGRLNVNGVSGEGGRDDGDAV